MPVPTGGGDDESELDKVLGDAMRRPLAETIAHIDRELSARWSAVEKLTVEIQDLRAEISALTAQVSTGAETLYRYAGSAGQRQRHSDELLSGAARWIASAVSSPLRDLEATQKAQEKAITELLIRTHRQTTAWRRLVVTLSCIAAVLMVVVCYMVVAAMVVS